VQGCGTPSKFATLGFADFRLGAMSPDDQNVTVFAPASSRTGRPKLYVLASKSGTLQAFDLRAPNDPLTSLAADDAAWSSATTLIVLAQQHVLTLDITTRASAALPISADRIAWRAPTLFYSTVNQGHATLHRYNLATKADAVSATLSVAPPGCAAPEQCAPIAPPWDISADSSRVYYQQVLATAPQGQLSALVAQPLLSGKQTEIFRAPSTLPMGISAAPDNLAVAAIWTNSAAGRHLKVATLGNGLTQDYPGQATLVWRPDSQALLNMPAAPQTGAAPHLILLTGNRDIALSDATADYLWLP
nr:hypothetical protein [Ktedonobacterales bacterium]